MDTAHALRAYFAGSAADTVSAYLFGSHARGTAHRDSDVDVGVLFDERRLATPGERSAATDRLNAALVQATHCNRVDVVVLNDAPAELGATVIRTGQQLVCRDRELDLAFARRIQLRAADLRPFLERTRRLKVAYLTR